MKTDWRKLIAIGVAGAVVPTVGAWANTCVQGATCAPFTLGNVLSPAIPTLLSTAMTLLAFFTQAKKAA